TVKRILRRIRQDEPRLLHRKPARGNALTKDIPMRQIAWAKWALDQGHTISYAADDTISYLSRSDRQVILG
ncbi:MAG: hypothetical protein KAT29_02325, partial [Anaerolineales bacterium]|nr:hypothetical protein [Anaerolineales bacterium]